MALWGGRFAGEADALFKHFNDSLRFDRRLVTYDIQGSIAWGRALEQAGVLTSEEAAMIVSTLEELDRKVRASSGELLADAADEDVHSWVEAQLIARTGDLGKKLHTGRSRNDQVATDLRLYARAEIGERLNEIHALQGSLIDLAERERDTVLPGYTHLQRAQPVLFAHWCLAYVEMLARDAGRFRDARERIQSCPLGSGALAGTAYPIDRAALAQALGFAQASRNSLDAVSDRDFALEILSAAALTALHLSRMAEDLILYNSAEFGFVEMDEGVSTGSSLMPQKKNPDALELVRGKCGRILGAQTALAVTLKGLPLAYNKDLQEDKEPLFDALDSLALCLRVLPRVLDPMRVHAERSRSAARGGYANATDLADYLVSKGVPFREAHEITGRIVRHAIERGKALEDLTVEELRTHAACIEESLFPRLQLERTLSSRDVPGGTAPRRVSQAIAEARVRHAASAGEIESET